MWTTDLFINGNDINLGTGSATTTISGGFGIGIGTTTPGAALAVATSTDGVNTAFLVSNLGTGYTAWFQDTANDTTPFVIDAAGNIGIGTTTPAAAFAIATSTDQVVSAFLLSNLGAGPTAYFEDVANDTSPTVIDTAGNLGVGTTTPGTLFSVQEVANLSVASSTFYNAVSANRFIATSTTATSTLSNGIVLSQSAGAVGVGTSTPAKALSVNGSILAGGVSNSTTTVMVDGVGTGVGGCISLRATDGTWLRIYATSSPTAAQAYTNAGGAQGYEKLVVEAGACSPQF